MGNFKKNELIHRKSPGYSHRRNKIGFRLHVLGFTIVAFCFLFSPFLASGAELFFETKSQTLAVNQQFELKIFLDTELDEINAIEGKIVFPSELLELDEIRDGNSIILFWLEKPEKNDEGEIIFSGITPGGYNGRKGFIFSLIFRTKREGEGMLELKDQAVFLNDGLGSQINVLVPPLVFAVKPELEAEPLAEINDNAPPEPFLPLVSQTPEIFGGKHFLVFATQDKGSGIAGYFIFETIRKREFIGGKEWRPCQSPCLLKDQALKSYIYLKARDKAGNERMVMVLPKFPQPWYKDYFSWLELLLFLILGGIIYLIYGNKKKIKKIFKTR